jgi:hypothetical protein
MDGLKRHDHLQHPLVRALGAQTRIAFIEPLRSRSRNGCKIARCRSRRRLGQKAGGAAGTRKSGGFRTLVATKWGDRWVFVFGFSKNERSNIDKDEEEVLKKLAAHLLSLTAAALDKAQRAGEIFEVNCDAQDEMVDS